MGFAKIYEVFLNKTDEEFLSIVNKILLAYKKDAVSLDELNEFVFGNTWINFFLNRGIPISEREKIERMITKGGEDF